MWDVFISHAWEDKEAVARPLCERLSNLGLRIWYDEFTFTLGDSLRRSIDRGLAESRFGVVILSQDFFSKEWPQKELDGLTTRERNSCKVILPIWHNVDLADVARYSPTLADKLAISTAKGLDIVAQEILRVVTPNENPLDSTYSETDAQKSEPIRLELDKQMFNEAEILQLIQKVQSRIMSLSQCITESLVLARKTNNDSLEEFCKDELLGYFNNEAHAPS